MDEIFEDSVAAQHWEQAKREYEERMFFMERRLGAEVHWFFIQGLEALKRGLFLPACSSFIIGVEASLRVTMAQIEKPTRVEELDPVKTLSNRLLMDAKRKGVPIELLAFPDEDDFEGKLASVKPNIRHVEIVRVRHNLCHGNILEFVNTELGEDNAFFTPECCSTLAVELLDVSMKWVRGLGAYRRDVLGA